jgi:hypothetical protein
MKDSRDTMVVVRSSLVASLALFASGCLLAEPPERNPRQTPPILNLAQASPGVTRLLVLDGPTVLPFSIPVRSEDVGESIRFGMHRNYSAGAPRSDRIFGPEEIEPSHLNDTSREIAFNANLPAPTPCYQLTLVVCHVSSFELGEALCRPDSLDDTALATWWVVSEEAGEAGLEGCLLPAVSQ